MQTEIVVFYTVIFHNADSTITMYISGAFCEADELWNIYIFELIDEWKD